MRKIIWRLKAMKYRLRLTTGWRRDQRRASSVISAERIYQALVQFRCLVIAFEKTTWGIRRETLNKNHQPPYNGIPYLSSEQRKQLLTIREKCPYRDYRQTICVKTSVRRDLTAQSTIRRSQF